MGVDGLTYEQPPTLGATPPPGISYMPDVATKKYADSTGSVTYYDGHSVDILRYADVLLSRAEALNELSGPTAESIDLINQVKGKVSCKIAKPGRLYAGNAKRCNFAGTWVGVLL